MKNSTRLVILCILVVVIAVAAVVVVIQNNQKNDEVADTASSAGKTSVQDNSVLPGLTADTEGPQNAPALPKAAGLTGPVTATFSASINRSIIPFVSSLLINSYPDAQDMLESAANIADHFVLEGTWDGSAAQIRALLKDRQVAYAAVRSEGNTVTAVSDALPNNTMIQMTANELMRAAGLYYGDQELNLSFTTDDLRMLESAAVSMLRKIDSEIAVRTDAEETGSWTFEGKTYSARRRINATTRDIGLIVLKAFRDAVQDPQVSALLSRFGADPQSFGLDRQIGNMESSADEETAVLEAFRYSNGNGDTFTDGVFHTFNIHYRYNGETGEETVIREPGDDIYFQYGTVERNFRLRVSVPTRGEFFLTADSGKFEAVLSLDQVSIGSSVPKLSAKLTLSGTTAENGERDGSIAVQVSAMDILTMNYSIRQGEKIAASFDSYDRKVYSADDLSTGDFRDQVKSKLMEIAGKVTEIMPEDVEKLMPLARKVLRYIY